MREPNWINADLALAIHERQLAEHGGQGSVREVPLLESVLARPQQLYSLGTPPRDLCALAASYALGIAGNHPFPDGNKRTAFVICRLFLTWNGLTLSVPREDRYFKMLALSAGDLSEKDFATWLRANTATS